MPIFVNYPADVQRVFAKVEIALPRGSADAKIIKAM